MKKKIFIILLVIVCVLLCTSCTAVPSNVECIHEWKRATCTQPKTCSVCSTKEGFALGHTWGAQTIIEQPTCSEAGSAQKQRTACFIIENTVLSKINHTYDNGVINKQATCDADGNKVYTCTLCGETKNELINKLGHQVNVNNICTVCGIKVPPNLNMTAQEVITVNSVSYISNRTTQYDEQSYSQILLFSLLDKDSKEIAPPTLVDIRIVNDNDVTVYTATRIVKSSDYGTWTSPLLGSHLQASVYIKDTDIAKGNIESGKLYYKVYNPGYVSFDEIWLSVSDLPVKDTKVNLPALPLYLKELSYSYDVDEVAIITGITYEISGTSLYIYFAGEKTYDIKGSKNATTFSISYQLLDSQGYIVDSGSAYTPSLFTGDKFKDVKGYVWDIKIGETYTLKVIDASY
ncbi:MAG: hypothetical protein WCY62_08345 [Clostridia bacterium]